MRERPRSNSLFNWYDPVAPNVSCVVSLVATSSFATKLPDWREAFSRVGTRVKSAGVKKSALNNAPLTSPEELMFWRNGLASKESRAASVMRYTPSIVGRVSAS